MYTVHTMLLTLCNITLCYIWLDLNLFINYIKLSLNINYNETHTKYISYF